MMSDGLNFEFNFASFLVGFTTASVFWWLFSVARKIAPRVIAWVKSQMEHWRQKNFGNIEQFLRLDVQKRAQRNHLTGQLFALDEILIKPRLLVPSGYTIHLGAQSTRSFSSTLIPYLPDWPEIVSQYPYPSISLTEAIQKKANLVILGPAGAGKTVALAHLATLIARNDTQLGERHPCFPIYLHVNELTLPQTEESDPFSILVTAIANRSPLIIQKRVAPFLKGLDQQNRLILILDGLDELHPRNLAACNQYLKSLISSRPHIQIIVTSSTLHCDGLLKSGFIPLTLASWSHAERIAFITNWQNLWSNLILPQIQRNSPTQGIDPVVLTNWVEPDNLSLTPLEWTLRLWSLYAGDLTGSSNLNAIQAYIERTSRGIISIGHLQNLAVGFFNTQKNALTYAELENILSRFIPEQSETAENRSEGKKKGARLSSTGKAIDGLLRSGLLQEFSSGVFAFSHPVIMGFLASFMAPEPISRLDGNVSSEPIWILTDLVEHYQAAQSRAVGLIEQLLLYPDPPLFLNLLRVCRWVKDAPSSLQWRTQVMRQVVQLIHREDLPFSLRARLLSATTCMNDPYIPVLLRQLLASPSARVRQLAALGCGGLQDQKALDGLTKLLTDPVPEVSHSAAFAIGIIKTASALSITEELLRSGDENLSQVAAECLAASPEDGHLLLRASTESDQILVRRAAVIGLAQTGQDWAFAIIEKMAIQDGQWVVRNVAGQAIESRKHLADNLYPNPLPPAHESPWLLAYASQSGVGISPGDSGVEILLSALQKGTPQQKISALEYFRSIHTDAVLSAIIQAVRDGHPEVEQAALNTLWLYALSGAQITA